MKKYCLPTNLSSPSQTNTVENSNYVALDNFFYRNEWNFSSSFFSEAFLLYNGLPPVIKAIQKMLTVKKKSFVRTFYKNMLTLKVQKISNKSCYSRKQENSKLLINILLSKVLLLKYYSFIIPKLVKFYNLSFLLVSLNRSVMSE